MKLPDEVATLKHPARSLSGRFLLKIVEQEQNGLPMQGFQIFDDAGQLVFDAGQAFDVRHSTYFLWGEGERVWVYSGDVGTYFWEQESGKWRQHSYARSTVAAPTFLKALRPQQHTR